MNLTTQVPFNAISPAITYDKSVVFIGSCFTQNIGLKMQYYGFKTLMNPFGILFNPLSIGALIHRSIHDIAFNTNDVEDHFSYLAHSDITGTTQQEVCDQMNLASSKLKNTISTASHLFITLGSAWVYRHLEKNMIVANCHKQPAQLFEKELLAIDQIITVLQQITQDIHHINPHCTITFTVSPVRHTKDGFVENQRSKSRLHEAIQSTCESTNANYLPVYEYVMDELRDYRFYSRDLVHLNELGIELVWLRFRESVINQTVLPIMNQVEKYRKLQSHRPKDQAAHEQQLIQVKQQLVDVYPFLSL